MGRRRSSGELVAEGQGESGCIGTVRMCGSGGGSGVAKRHGKKPAEFCGRACAQDVAAGGDGVEGAGGDDGSAAGGEDCGDRAEVGVSDWRGGGGGDGFAAGDAGVAGVAEAGFRIWPYDEPDVKRAPVVVEIYTRLMTGAVNKSSEVARTAYLAKKRRESAMYAGLVEVGDGEGAGFGGCV